MLKFHIMVTPLLILIAVLLLIDIWTGIWVYMKAGRAGGAPAGHDELKNQISYMDAGIKDELARTREEARGSAKEAREELSNSLRGFSDSISARMAEVAQLQKNQLDAFSGQLVNLTRSNIEQLEKMTGRHTELINTVEKKLEGVREAVEARLKSIQDDTGLKLEKMRETVDEKLHKTLEQRLGESFRLVSERLEQVHKGLGDMQNLAVGVGDLKRMLSNVKTRGIHGEIQLGNILEQILAPEQYERNVATKKGARENVEFAIRLPGRDLEGSLVYLPIDSKFPLEVYYGLGEAYEQGNPVLVEEAAKLLEQAIKKSAKDIRDKYLDPPGTTDFGIMFLPIEGLYAEVVRRPGLFEVLQREYRITITGPTTLAAFLNSLQMGFSTLAIEKRSSEVWKILGAVKTEFDRFGDVLKRAQDKLSQTSKELDALVGVRSRQIQVRLRNIQRLPEEKDLFIQAGGAEGEEKADGQKD
ncbi:MAG: DNA recombination protein RmuC [Nitrospiraceae bacterium]|nr:DNA recombination protein RmuC [Nitrospiraceae bacterium]